MNLTIEPGRNGGNETEENCFKSASTFNILSTNARSLTPKIDCCVEHFKELEISIAFLTETWLCDSTELTNDIADLEIETGYSMLCRNRPQNDRGYSAGGVAIAFKKSSIQLKEIQMPGNEYEILFSVGTLPKFSRKNDCYLYVYATGNDCGKC